MRLRILRSVLLPAPLRPMMPRNLASPDLEVDILKRPEFFDFTVSRRIPLMGDADRFARYAEQLRPHDIAQRRVAAAAFAIHRAIATSDTLNGCSPIEANSSGLNNLGDYSIRIINQSSLSWPADPALRRWPCDAARSRSERLLCTDQPLFSSSLSNEPIAEFLEQAVHYPRSPAPYGSTTRVLASRNAGDIVTFKLTHYLMLAILAPNDQPDAGGGSVAERHRRARAGIS